jgi:hypothetical protein
LSHHNTIFSQILKLVPRHEFEALANQHHKGRKLRKMTRWSQFVALGLAQLSNRHSLRDIVYNMNAQVHKLYHLGIACISRSSLARVNEQQPYELYERLCGKILSRCHGYAPRHSFKFKNKLYSLDSSTIDLCLSMFPWAKFRATKGAVKLHVGLDHQGYLPTFLRVTDGKVHDMTIARDLDLPSDSIVVFDRGYAAYNWFNTLNSKGIFFVTRQKSRAAYTVFERNSVNKKQGLTSDQTIRIKGEYAKTCPFNMRRIGYRDPETGKHYSFLTNNFSLSAMTIARIYQSRWQIELFFKWIKQNLRIKTYLGTSKNAVLTQIWIAMCIYLILCYIKFANKLGFSLQQILRLLQLNLFERRDLMALLKPPLVSKEGTIFQTSLSIG